MAGQVILVIAPLCVVVGMVPVVWVGKKVAATRWGAAVFKNWEMAVVVGCLIFLGGVVFTGLGLSICGVTGFCRFLP